MVATGQPGSRRTRRCASLLFLTAASAREWCRPGAPCWPSVDELRGICATPGCRVLLPEDDEFANASLLRDTQWTFTPGLIVQVASVEDVQRAVRFAAAKSVEPRVFNTGHCYDGHCSGDGVLRVDVGALNATEWVTSGDTFRIGSGCRWGDVYAWLGNSSGHRRCCVGGGDPSVGVTGWTLGGGHGPMTRAFGIGVQQVISFEVVDAAGAVKTASATSEPELFWALRGGGGGTFGIVTSFTLRSHPDTAVHYAAATANMSLGLYADFAARRALLNGVGDWLAAILDPTSGDASISGTVELDHGARHQLVLKLLVRGGDAASASRRVAGLAKLVARNPAVARLDEFASYDSFGQYAASIPSKPPGAPETSASALLAPGAVAASVAAIVEGVEQLFAAASHGTEFQCTADMVGGAALAALDDAASVHDAWRATALVMACSAYGWAEGGRDAAAAALNAWSARALAPLSRVGARNQSAYVNEAQTDGFDVPWSELFWGSRYGRLLDVKRSVDPDGFWRCPNCVGSEL